MIPHKFSPFNLVEVFSFPHLVVSVVRNPPRDFGQAVAICGFLFFDLLIFLAIIMAIASIFV